MQHPQQQLTQRQANPAFLPHRHLRALGLAALCAVAAPAALAQSAEYRRGYEDGFRAAQSGGQPQQPGFGIGGYGGPRQPDYAPGYGNNDGGGGGRRIAILDARYGRGNSVCDAREAVQQIVDERGGAAFEVNNDLCGDPAANQTKVLNVTYRCGRGGGAVRASAPEGRALRIACR